MNYHYIDYMLKERRRQELEECERIQLLKSAEYKRTSPAYRLFSRLNNGARRWGLWLTRYANQPGRISLTPCSSAGALGNEMPEKRSRKLLGRLFRRQNTRSK